MSAQTLERTTRGGQCRRLLLSTDWSRTSLGPIESWSPALRAIADMIVDSPVAKVLMWGPDHRMIYNDAYSVVAGANHPRAFGACVDEVWPEIWDFNRAILAAGFRGEVQSYLDRHLVLNRNGRPEDVYFDLYYTPIYETDERVGGVLCTVSENTNRVLDRHRLHESNERFRAAMEAVHGVLWTNSADGRMIGEQPGWSALTGQSEAEYSGFGWAKAVHPDDVTATQVAWLKAVETTTPFVHEHRVRRRDGSWGSFAIRALPILDGRGTAAQWVGVHTDITEQRAAEAKILEHAALLERQIAHRRRAEDQLRQMNDTLETRIAEAIAERREAEKALAQSQKMETIGKLTGGVAHDFNNLLQVISGNLQLLSRDVAGNLRAETRVANALAGVSRGAKLASHLLAFGRRQALEPKVVNLTRFVRGMDDMLSRALGGGIEVEIVATAGLWNTFIDPTQVENALLNLAINARDAMDGLGRLTIELGNASLDDDYARSHEEVRAGQYVMLAVSDTGSGMSPEIIEKVFEPFFSTKAEGKGSGLGLSMVYGFVKQSGGHVKIYSEIGHGTTVRLYLPRATQAEDIEIAPVTGPIAGGTETILVVEDDEDVRATVVDLLTELGYRVLKAPQAQAALSVVESGVPIDLLFTDVVMPGPLRSPELARMARERIPGIAVLFTSGYTENSIVHGGRLDAGVNLLSKPYSREALARKIRHVLANQQQRNAAAAQGSADALGSVEVPGEAVRQAASAPSLVPADEAAPAADKPVCVLLVEDDGLIRMNTAELIQDLGHVVVEAGSAEEAMAALQTMEIDVLVTDVNLPGQSGPQLAKEARRLHAAIGVVFATGDRTVSGIEAFGRRASILNKPYDGTGLERAIEAVLADPVKAPA